MFLIIGWGVYKQLWIAALCGVLIFLIERIILWWYQTSMPLVTVVTALLVVLFYVQSIRGILKWKKLKGRMGRTESADENRNGIGGESSLQGKESRPTLGGWDVVGWDDLIFNRRAVEGVSFLPWLFVFLDVSGSRRGFGKASFNNSMTILSGLF